MSHGPDIWVVEQYAHRFRHLDAAGREVFSFRREGDMPNQVSFPRGPRLQDIAGGVRDVPYT